MPSPERKAVESLRRTRRARDEIALHISVFPVAGARQVAFVSLRPRRTPAAVFRATRCRPGGCLHE